MKKQPESIVTETAEKLYEAISDIREEFIDEAELAASPKKHTPNLLKWGSLAACFCLIFLAAGTFFGLGFQQDKVQDNNGGMPNATPAPGGMQTVLAYNGALFQVSNELSVLNVAGIPDTITSEDCGETLGNLRKTEQGYEETTADTDIEFYKYAAATSNTAVVVIRDGEEYMAGMFSNALTSGTDTRQSSISALYERYGVESAEHIISIAEVVMQNATLKNDSLPNSSLLDNTLIAAGNQMVLELTDQTALRAFYEASVMLKEETYTFDLFEKRYLCITTVEGLKFYLCWDMEKGFLYSPGTLEYYRITDAMKNWLQTYLP